MSTDEQMALPASTKMRPHLVARGGLPRGGDGARRVRHHCCAGSGVRGAGRRVPSAGAGQV